MTHSQDAYIPGGESSHRRTANVRRGPSLKATPRSSGHGVQHSLALLTASVNNAPDLSSALQQITQQAATVFGASMATVFIYSDDGEMEACSSVGLSPRFSREIEKLGKTSWATGYLAGAGEPLFIEIDPTDLQPSPLHKLASSEGVSSLASFPLLTHEKLIGVLLLFNAGEHVYGDSEMDSLTTLANYTALVLANFKLVETRRWERKAQDQFLDMLNHELRTPLTSIMGFTQMIRRRFGTIREPDVRLRDQLDQVWVQAQRLNRLLDTFVDISNIERGEFTIDHGRVDLCALLNSSVELTTTQARSRHQMSLDLTDHPVWIIGDMRRLEHVFSHVLSNALRYGGDRKPVRVSCKVNPAEGQAEISVSDSGPGIPPDLLKQIFKRFYPSDTRRAGGMGAGLYVSRAIVEAHGGSLAIQSELGSGTTVKISLPL